MELREKSTAQSFIEYYELMSQTFLIDADDTLWENNIYFERAIANFISFLIIKSTRQPKSEQ